MKILAIETSCDETSIAIAEFSGPKRNPHVQVFSHIVLSQIKLHAEHGGVVPNLAKREHQKNLVPILLQALREADFLESRSKNQEVRHSHFPSKRGMEKMREAKSLNSKFLILDSILDREPELLAQFKKHIMPLPAPDIDAIAVTYGPGLAPALWVGINFAKALAVLWDKPLIPVNHMAGHLYSALLKAGQRNPKPEARNPKQIQNSNDRTSKPFEFRISNFEFPAVSLLVSGGHTELVLMKKQCQFEIIGETLDDAAGEAFDKVARMLGLGYPGGPVISASAEIALIANRQSLIVNTAEKIPPNLPLQKGGEKHTPSFPKEELGRILKLPRPMINSKDFNFSFSGLKTAVLYLTRDLGNRQTKKLIPAIAKEFQNAVVDVLVAKTIRAAKTFSAKTILLGGGVSANKLLQERLGYETSAALPNSNFYIPDSRLTGDNALMIATAAFFCGKKKAPTNNIGAEPNLRL